MIPRIGEPVVPGKRYRRRPGIYAVLLRGNAVLMTYQSEPKPEYQLPGGGIDPGEQPVRALHREVYEETGWRIDTPVRLGAFRRFTFMPEYELWAEKICHIYLARPALCLGPPIEPTHHAVWMSLANAIALAGNEGDAMFLERLRQSF
ncbi:MAG: NUDIX hydrolase [Boseongicola sp.]|nr:NUDIX hydrolase [Boseongicola sp.]NNJ68388.1 NUDIX hydrolase [Boseongicola sp.]